MKIKSLFLVIIIVTSCQKNMQKEENKETTFYVGTYTQKESKGIYKYSISDKGVLKKIGLAAEIENPSFLAKTTDKKTLVAVSETDKNGTGFIKSYTISNDSLTLLSTQETGGAHPCFVTTKENGFVLAANYSGGNVGLLKTDDSGELSTLLNVQQHVGKGSTDRQQSPHAHSAWFHPTKNEVISADLGTNELWFSIIDTTKNEFIFTNQKILKMANGAGPRHLTFHPNHQWIYVLNELNNTISLIKEEDNSYYIDSSFSMLPEYFTGYSKGADIHVSKDGKFLYASNRGHETIVIYEVNSVNGYLTTIGYEPVLGKNPRNFSLSPDENFLVVANQDTDNIISFKRNTETGKLSFVSEIEADMPVCVLF
jgi:6-phosphogluconolactonase